MSIVLSPLSKSCAHHREESEHVNEESPWMSTITVNFVGQEGLHTANSDEEVPEDVTITLSKVWAVKNLPIIVLFLDCIQRVSLANI